MNGYQINEKDIATIIRHLKIHRPEQASRENAIKMLKSFKRDARGLADTDPEFAEMFLKALEELQQESEEAKVEEEEEDQGDDPEDSN